MVRDSRLPGGKNGATDAGDMRELASYQSMYLEDITRHVEAHIGKIDFVQHELISFVVHTDILVVQPTKNLPFITIVTSGLSEKRMNLPEPKEDGMSDGLAEFIAFLPPNWPIRRNQNQNEEADYHWPLDVMSSYTKHVHEAGDYYDWYHTSANGSPPSPFAPGTSMSGFLFTPPFVLPESAWEIATQSGDRIRLLNVVPILSDEIDYGAENGGGDLCQKLLEASAQFDFDPNRLSCLARRKKFFGLF